MRVNLFQYKTLRVFSASCISIAVLSPYFFARAFSQSAKDIWLRKYLVM